MKFKAAIILATTFLTLGNANLTFLDFRDVCDPKEAKTCTNNQQEVSIIQKFLNIGNSKKIAITGKFNNETKEAIIAFQKENNIMPATGYIGLQTKMALEQKFRALKSRINNKVQKVASKPNSKQSIKPTNHKLAKKAIINNKKSGKKAISAKTYDEFKKFVNLRKSYRIFQNYSLLKKANPKNTLLKVDVSEQRVKLVVNGKVALCAPCTTGAKRKLEPNTRTYRDKRTPTGTFKILEKIANKKSTIFGDMYRNGRRVYHGDRRKYRGPKAKYVGHTLQNWMRLTSGGIGMHASHSIKRYPGSNGCIRLPYKVSKIIFSKVGKGTKVVVSN